MEKNEFLNGESYLYYTVPSDLSFLPNNPPSISSMAGAPSAFAFKHNILAWILLPINIFTGFSLMRKLDIKTAVKITRETHSLAWALRAWCYVNNMSFSYNPNGDLLEVENSPNGMPTHRYNAQALYNGWALSSFAMQFDWEDRSFFEKTQINIPNSYLYILTKSESDGIGYVYIITYPEFDYNANPIAQIDYYMRQMNLLANDIVSQYNIFKSNQNNINK